MNLRFEHHTLPNGLTIVAEPNPEAHTASVGFFVRTGARDEQAPVMGVSHFLEHMMFKGTARRSADDVNREFDELGANYNAYTSHENTVYYAQVLPEFLPRAVDLLGDMLRPALRVEDFDMEKNVILEEIGMYDDRPQWRLQDTLIERYFQNHTLGFRVLGTNDTVGKLAVDQMRDYFTQRYSPDNITVAAAGRFDFDTLVKDIEAVAGHWEPTGAARRYDEPAPGDQSITLSDAKLSRHYLALMTPAPSAQDPRRYAAHIFADVLGDSDGSRLYWALVDPGLADEADVSHYAQDRVGAYVAYASCDPKRAEQVEKVLTDTIDRFTEQLDPAEIERAKNKIATQTTLRSENPMGRMRSLGGNWVYLQRYMTMQEELEQIMAVTADDVLALCEAFPMRPRTVVRLGPNAE